MHATSLRVRFVSCIWHDRIHGIQDQFDWSPTLEVESGSRHATGLAQPASQVALSKRAVPSRPTRSMEFLAQPKHGMTRLISCRAGTVRRCTPTGGTSMARLSFGTVNHEIGPIRHGSKTSYKDGFQSTSKHEWSPDKAIV